MGSKNKVIDFREIQQQKMSGELGFNFDSDVWVIKTDLEAAEKKIRFKIKAEEIEEVYCCIEETIEGLPDLIDMVQDEEEYCSEIEERIEVLERINSILEDKIEYGTGTFLNISYYDFEIFLCALESEVDGYLDIETRELDIDEDMDEGFVYYLEVIKKVYDRLNAKYYNDVEEVLHPGMKQFRQYAKGFLESPMSNKRDDNIELSEKDTELSSFEKLKEELEQPYKAPTTEEEKIEQMLRHYHLNYDDIIVVDGDYLLVYNKNFLRLNLIQFDFNSGTFKHLFNIENLNEEHMYKFRKTYNKFELLNKKNQVEVVLNLKKDYEGIDFGWMPMLRD